jgi:hypothetical protein
LALPLVFLDGQLIPKVRNVCSGNEPFHVASLAGMVRRVPYINQVTFCGLWPRGGLATTELSYVIIQN